MSKWQSAPVTVNYHYLSNQAHAEPTTKTDDKNGHKNAFHISEWP